VGGVGGENSSSKAFGISFADRPKAKMGHYTQKVYTCMRQLVSNCKKIITLLLQIYSHASAVSQAAAAAAALRLRLAARLRSSLS
jgi:hypothetical protein